MIPAEARAVAPTPGSALETELSEKASRAFFLDIIPSAQTRRRLLSRTIQVFPAGDVGMKSFVIHRCGDETSNIPLCTPPRVLRSG